MSKCKNTLKAVRFDQFNRHCLFRINTVCHGYACFNRRNLTDICSAGNCPVWKRWQRAF